jgi:Neurotransmitter-gated ion-channel ligand binding domain
LLGAESGLHERRLLTDLLETYNRLERPVQNETEAVILYFGLTLQQIIDVVRIQIRNQYYTVRHLYKG